MFALLKHHSTSWGGQYNYANFQCGLAPRIYWYVFIYFMNSFIKNEIDYLVVCKLDDFNWIYISITFLSGNPLCMWYSWNSLTRLTWLIHTSVLPSNWNLDEKFALTGQLRQVHMVKKILPIFIHAGRSLFLLLNLWFS